MNMFTKSEVIQFFQNVWNMKDVVEKLLKKLIVTMKGSIPTVVHMQPCTGATR